MLVRLETVDLEKKELDMGQENMGQVTKTYLDGLGIKLEALLVSQELLDILSLITLQLNHLAHLSVSDDGAIAS
jgi:hypothetical protein